MNRKITLRKEVLNKLQKFNLEQKEAENRVIRKKLFALDCFKASQTILVTVSRQEEVDTHAIIRDCLNAGKNIVVPRVVGNGKMEIRHIHQFPSDLEKGSFGILEPSEACPISLSSELDCAIIPGIAFDLHKRRLGRGGGYFDRFLSTIPPHVQIIGLAYKLQIIESVPSESHDISVQHLITS